MDIINSSSKLFINNCSNMEFNNVGYLKIIMGPMFSGKTSSIIELYNKYKHTHFRVCIVNYAEDKRYSENQLSTHDKIMIPCLNLYNLKSIFNTNIYNESMKVTQSSNIIDNIDIFMINEAQFFPDLKNTVLELVEKYNKTVYLFGLDGDFKRNGFQQFMELIPYADEVEKKYSICKECRDGTRALFSHRLSGGDEVKVIGSDNYIPLCRKCYLKYNTPNNTQ